MSEPCAQRTCHSYPVLGYYLIVITNRENVGTLRGHDIYRVGSFQILPLARNLNGLSEEQVSVYDRERGR